MNDEKFSELIELANRHIENQLDESARTRLEEILQTDAESRRIFVDFLHDNAALHWEKIESDEDSLDLLEFPVPMPQKQESKRFFPYTAVAAAIAMSLVALFLLAKNDTGKDLPAAFATMEKTSAARWQSGDLPTLKGARLGAGRLSLAEGLATLKFDSGAEVILEAPAEIQIVDAMNCLLVNGTAVADVPESAIGFQIKTPSANVVDYGTRFAVNVDERSGATKTQVFEGLVEVEHPDTGKIVRLETGEGNFVAGDQISDAETGPDEGEWNHESTTIRRNGNWRILPAIRDSYVYSVDIGNHTSDVLLLLKHSEDPKGPNRKTYLGFDLSSIDREKIEAAELILNFTPTGWGLASVVPDSTFSVYGITDSALDQWTYRSMTWQNAPANAVKTGNRLISGKAVKLGEFTLEQGIQRGQHGIQTADLAKFLRESGDGFATIAIVRDTVESEGGGLVHGIASRRHPTLPPPTLAIQFSD